MAVIIQAQYELLESIAARFGQQADLSSKLHTQLQQSAEALLDGGWLGRGADAFSNEMRSELFPAVERFIAALQAAQTVTREIIQVVQNAEEEAATPFRGEYAGSPTSSAGPGQSVPGGGSTRPGALTGGAGPTSVGSGGLSPEEQLLRDGVEAVHTARSGATFLGSVLAPGTRLGNLVKSLGFRGFGGGVFGLLHGLDAADRGVSTPAAVADGTVAGVLSLVGPKGLTLSTALAAVVHGVTNAISPEAGEYTKVGLDVMPSQVGIQLAVGTIDTADAIVRGDTEQLVKHHEQNLAGEYGNVVRGYAIGFDALGAVVTGDQSALNDLSDKAASGELGPLADFGDWLGGEVYDWFN